jgi:hypothetical protein
MCRKMLICSEKFEKEMEGNMRRTCFTRLIQHANDFADPDALQNLPVDLLCRRSADAVPSRRTPSSARRSTCAIGTSSAGRTSDRASPASVLVRDGRGGRCRSSSGNSRTDSEDDQVGKDEDVDRRLFRLDASRSKSDPSSLPKPSGDFCSRFYRRSPVWK